ncbi:hypothetical protein CYMTET_50137 [Cymbomonas tetramitiformis]|uniref:Uncharacterized protein n=1 Tax=Cymbomonas tetramitiformis TaxID=36881 RepID=A0AAE0BQD0_9CHLO|nr:hypothetical protein CYMTET_50137 [Cymbomonas tetramitiformis]
MVNHQRLAEILQRENEKALLPNKVKLGREEMLPSSNYKNSQLSSLDSTPTTKFASRAPQSQKSNQKTQEYVKVAAASTSGNLRQSLKSVEKPSGVHAAPAQAYRLLGLYGEPDTEMHRFPHNGR